MKTLVDTILSVEADAENRITAARAEAKAIEERARNQVAAVRQELMEQMEQRVAAFRKKTEEEFNQAVRQIEEEHKKTLAMIDAVPDDLIDKLAESISEKFRNR